MGAVNWLWYLGAGFLLGWVLSTLTEWLWFRRKHIRGTDRPLQPEVVDPPVLTPLPTPEVAPWRTTSGAAYRPYRPVLETDETHENGPPKPASSRRTLGAPRLVAVDTVDRPDPLSVIQGIGAIYQKRLYEAGIFTWHQLADTAPDVLRAATRADTGSNPEDWIEQARGLAERYHRVGAIYTGPAPDDLTRIDGIGAVYERELYRSGIYTYAQLAELTPADLARIVPDVSSLGEDTDYRIWIEQARSLRDVG